MDGKVGHKLRGLHITQSGRGLEDSVAAFLVAMGWQEFPGTKTEFIDSLHKLRRHKYFMQSVPVGLSEYGFYATKLNKGEGIQKADLILSGVKGFPDGLRIELKTQKGPGSADEKLHNTVANIERAQIPGIIVMDGPGFRTGTFECIKAKVDTNEFLHDVYELNIFYRAFIAKKLK